MPRPRTDHAPTPAAGNRPRWRTAAIATGVVAVAAGGLYVAGLVTTGDDISAGTRAGGVDIGGLSKAEAAERLRAQAPASWTAPIAVQVGERTERVSPAAAGLTVDAEATAERAADPSRDPFTVIGRLFSSGDREIEPVLAHDAAKTDAAVAALAKENDRAVKEGSVSFADGEAVSTRPVAGQKLDTAKAADALRAAYPSAPGAAAVALPRGGDPAEAGRHRADPLPRRLREARRLRTGHAHRRRPAPEHLPETLGDHLTVKNQNGRLTGSLDSTALLRDPDVARPLAP
ncbi:hypothetical protein Shyd_72000 [Streptomyces hydrogenans]|uniref:YoaR-like putative peptidoglycan binding domain-containing protein n=1 Tax=Streptomyces hydrogenans TaxID=1873719 RepID=A0ABQ3PLC8_9ACTN|nr:peptidoglycan binding domain-containing protein [Streptomyces hydrogenans]GHI25829.1 hypothetical protein Shyd_72000 [Streptomyces hydrogenans]